MIKCSVCGKYIPEKNRFCHECGAPVDAFALEKATCPNCGKVSVTGDTFCRGCGKELPAVAKRKPIAIDTPTSDKEKEKGKDKDKPKVESYKESQNQMRYVNSVKMMKPLGMQSGYVILFALTLLAGAVFILGNHFYHPNPDGTNHFINVTDYVSLSFWHIGIVEIVFGISALLALFASFLPGGWARIFAIFPLGASCYGGYVLYDTYRMFSAYNLSISLGGYVVMAVLAVNFIASLVAVFNRSF